MAKDGITITIAQEEHIDQVIKLVQESFIPRAPLMAALGITSQDIDALFWAMLGEILKQGYSFVALDQQGRVIGCRISNVRPVERNQDPEPDFLPKLGESEKLKLFCSIFRALMNGWTKEVPDCETIFEFMILCVEKQYEGRGIAKELVNRSLKLAETLPVDYVYVITINRKAQNIFEKLNFTTIRTKNFDEFRDEAGNQLITTNEGTTCMNWMVKKLKK